MTTIHRISTGSRSRRSWAQHRLRRSRRSQRERLVRPIRCGQYAGDQAEPFRDPTGSDRACRPPGGFDWGDAGIGAAGGIALAMVGLGGTVAVSQRRGRRTRGSAARPADQRRNGTLDRIRSCPQVRGTPHVTTKLGRAVDRVVALSTLVAVGVSVLFLAVTGANRTSLAARPRSSRSAPLIHYYGTGAPRTVTRIHTTPATVAERSAAVVR